MYCALGMTRSRHKSIKEQVNPLDPSVDCNDGWVAGLSIWLAAANKSSTTAQGPPPTKPPLAVQESQESLSLGKSQKHRCGHHQGSSSRGTTCKSTSYMKPAPPVHLQRSAAAFKHPPAKHINVHTAPPPQTNCNYASPHKQFKSAAHT